ncbi:protein of unknown function (plasmid) [Azospirillum baldaniorum]|uniref:Uncharacterized protein n=1 Tax=Azospirillum baldaniorum TaxID=1064539 RepID=A0A9P1JXN0_9PROT|nr:protein of unknown function [Azospirillum baldaniorum]
MPMHPISLELQAIFLPTPLGDGYATLSLRIRLIISIFSRFANL